ncbi:MAG TPA: aminoglycoside phosphotransferase family protein [Vicinamibacterales bacterium]|nr:aminoglycoside phosphotransferase family protein [Vicinamibacterales bacterium]
MGGRTVLGFGVQAQRAVVLKVNDSAAEPFAPAVLDAFDGRGVARVYARATDAVLVERAIPGHSLTDVVARDGDEEATRLLAQTIAQMSPGLAPAGVPTAIEWGRGFSEYRASGDTRIPAALVSAAHDVYDRLAATQRHERLLHGDLHHGNLVFDGARGWLAIDPKGVVAELEFELGAPLRNPWDQPFLFTDPGVARRRARAFAASLGLDESRLLGWAFSQAVLAAIWMIEDEGHLDPDCPCVTLAERLRSF